MHDLLIVRLLEYVVKIVQYVKMILYLLRTLYYNLQNTAHTFQAELPVQKQQIQRKTSNVEINSYQIRQANLHVMVSKLSFYEQYLFFNEFYNGNPKVWGILFLWPLFKTVKVDLQIGEILCEKNMNCFVINLKY